MTDHLALWLSERLAAASLQGAAVIFLIWLVCRSIPNIPASVRAVLWWLAALKLVLALLPVPAVPIPILPAALDRTPGRAAVAVAPTASPLPLNPDAPPRLRVTDTPASPPDAAGVSWLQAAMLLWLGIVVLQAARLAAAWRELRGVVRRSMPAVDQEGTMARLSSLVGLERAPRIRISSEIASPQIVGLWRPVVLVPAGSGAELSDDERAMTLCHELMHIRRRDLALGWVPALAERLFFFHPLARLAAREYVTARESACDAAVVQALHVSPTDYGRMLVRLGVGGSVPALTAGGSSPSLSSLKRRLEMLQHAASSEPSRRSSWLIAIAGCALIPLHLVASTPGPEPPQEPAAAPEVASPAPVAPPAFEDADAARRKAAERATTLEAERAVRQHEAVERSMRAAAEAASQAQDQVSDAVAEAERIRIRNEAIHQQMREAAARVRSRFEQDSHVVFLEEIAHRHGTDSFDWQIEALRGQLEMLTQRLNELIAQQEQLAAAQRRLSEQADLMRRLSQDAERLRNALEAR